MDHKEKNGVDCQMSEKKPAYRIKTSLIMFSVLMSVILFPGISLAEGTRLINTTVLIESDNSKSVNVLSGNNGLVSTGSVNLETAQIDNSVIVNQSVNSSTITSATGHQKIAATGSIIIKNKRLSGVKLLNATNNIDTVAVANQSTRALIGSIHITQ